MARILYSTLEKYLSPQRLNKYRFPAKNNKSRTLKLYQANLVVSSSFYPLLSVLEISFRNSINEVLALHFNDSDWIVNQQNGFMSDNSLKLRNFYLKNEVNKATRQIRRNSGQLTSGKVIAEQTFGFWTSLLEPYHFRLIQGKTLNAFPNRPHGFGRSDVLRELKKIQKFRNRIYHNEPVCFQNNQIDFSTAIEIHQTILEVLSWINPDLGIWLKDLDTVSDKIRISKLI